MKPQAISEKMMFNTVKLVASDGSSGTGFFYNFKVDDMVYPTIVTNKHVVNDNPNELMTFLLHLRDEDGGTTENYKVTYSTKWIFHSSKDLCFCFVNPLFEQVKKDSGKSVFYITNDDSVVATPEKLNELSALEELVMVGYPIGLWDAQNNLPIFRKGYTASHPAFDFNEQGIGLVDMACFPGSSGSQIYILNENGYVDKQGNHYLGSSRVILVGILYAGPRYNAKGDIIVTTIPTKQKLQADTPVMINLGYYVKATELKEFEEYIRKLPK